MTRGRGPRRRVPGQQLHRGAPAPTRGRARRGFRRRVAVATAGGSGRRRMVDFVVAWRSVDQDGSRRSLCAPLLERRSSPRRRVPGQHLHRRPPTSAVAAAAGGASSSPGPATPRTAQIGGIFARRFTSTGQALAAREFSGQHLHQLQPGQLRLGGRGVFVVAELRSSRGRLARERGRPGVPGQHLQRRQSVRPRRWPRPPTASSSPGPAIPPGRLRQESSPSVSPFRPRTTSTATAVPKR